MSRHFRWQIVLPRLLLAVVLLLAGQYGLGLIVRTATVWSGESALNSRVEVAHARVSLLDRQVVLGDVRVADPRRPLVNLLEIDRCSLDFAAKPLLHKQAVIERGTISGLRFATPREASGAITDAPAPAVARSIQWFDDQTPKRAQEWLEQLDRRFDPDLINQFESIERTAALSDQLPERWDELKRSAAELAARGEQMRTRLDAGLTNPLRHQDALEEVRGEIACLQQDFERISADFKRLPEMIKAERHAIASSRHQDENWLREQLRVSTIDEEAMAAYLFPTPFAQSVEDAIGWLRLIRNLAPAEQNTRLSTSQRGEDILFAGSERAPPFLIRALALRGAARVGGQPVEIRGRLSDFSSEPAIHSRPMRLQVTATGALSLELKASVDRTRLVARDAVSATCDGIVMPETCLGASDRLQLVVAPSVARLSLNLTLEGSALSGDVQLTQPQVELTPVAGGSLGEASLAAALDEALNGVDNISTRIALGGTLDEPSCKLTSSLAPAVSQVLRVALKRVEDQHVRRLLAAAERQIDERFAQLDRQLADEQSALGSQLSQTANQLKDLVGQEKSPRRISKEQLGRRLSADSLFQVALITTYRPMSECAVIFDMDGVLVDSYHAHYESWLRMYRELGLEYTEDAFAADFGRTSREILRRTFGDDISDARIRAMDERKESFYREIIRADFPAMEGAVELLDSLRADQFWLAIGSSGPKENIALSLEKLGRADVFSAVVTGSDVARGKPDPQVFQVAAERLGVPTGRCVVVEDAPHGVEAARRAGMKCVALTGTGTRDQLSGADLVVDQLRELSPKLVRGLVP